VIGLGNPGSSFEGTRHNVGAEVVELLAERREVVLRSEKGVAARLVCFPARDQELEWLLQSEKGRVASSSSKFLVLAVPTTYMNDSGLAARDLWRRFNLSDLVSLVVVHDELDLEPGVVRVKQGGGLAGHNGLRSIRDALGSADFLRVRIGIGKPPSREQGANWVLSRPSRSERALLEEGVRTGAEAVEMIWAKGPPEAMTQFNAR